MNGKQFSPDDGAPMTTACTEVNAPSSASAVNADAKVDAIRVEVVAMFAMIVRRAFI